MTEKSPLASDKPTASKEEVAVKSTPPAKKRPTGVIVLLLILIGTVAIAYKYKDKYQPGRGTVENEVNLIGGPFTLTDHNGNTFTEQNLLGRYSLVFFGYTFCPDVCPTTLTDLGETMNLLGEEGEKVKTVFISVDPERDNPEDLKEYVAYFHPNVVGLTGTPEQVAKVAKAYRIYYSREKTENTTDDDYTLSHSSIVYLMGPNGKFLTHFSYGTDSTKIAQKILELM